MKAVVLVILSVAFQTANAAELDRRTADRIWLEHRPPTNNRTGFLPQRIRVVDCDVESIDDAVIVYHRDGVVQKASSAQVIWIEPSFDDSEIEAALKLYTSGMFKESIQPLLSAIEQGPPVWRAQWLSLHLWNATYASQRFAATLAVVSQIAARPLPDLILGGLPIHWINENLPVAAIDAAMSELSREGSPPAARLVAASWLIGGSSDPQAVATLNQLVTQNERPAIARLAAALLWKKSPPPELVRLSSDWQRRLENYPTTLYSGPAILLAQRLELAAQPGRALELYLSVSVTPPRPHLVNNFAEIRVAELMKIRSQ